MTMQSTKERLNAASELYKYNAVKDPGNRMYMDEHLPYKFQLDKKRLSPLFKSMRKEALKPKWEVNNNVPE